MGFIVPYFDKNEENRKNKISMLFPNTIRFRYRCHV